MSKIEKIYFSIVEWGVYVALFTPLILFRTYFFPYVSPKTIFFRLIVDIIFIAYILLVVANRRYFPKFNALTISITVFIGILVLTSLTGVNFTKSFWSTFERMTGLLTLFHLYVFFIILTSVFRERKYWERILNVSILAGVAAALYAVLANDPASRSGGTVGNISFLATYLSFNVFFAIILFFIKQGAWRIFYALSFGVMMLALFPAKEIPRGALGAIFPGFFLLVLGYLVFSGRKKLRRLAPLVLIFFILITIGFSQTTFFKTKFFEFKDIPGRARELVWGMGIESWQERPLLGWGLENFNIPFAKYFHPELPLTADVWYDRVHNIVLDMMVQAGILGLLSYLSIFGIAIIGLLKICSKIIVKRNLFAPLGMIVILLVYFIQNIFVFDMISSYLMFFLSLAFINFLISKNGEEIPMSLIKRNRLTSLVGSFLIILTIFTFYYGNIQSARASKLIVRGIASSLEQATSDFQKSLGISPMSIFDAPEQFSKKVTGLIYDRNQNREVLEKGLSLAAQDMEKNIVQNPQDFRFYLILGRHYNEFYNFTSQEEKLNLAEKFLIKASELSPKNQQAYWSLAQTRLFQNRTEEAFELLKKAIDLEPRYAQSHWYLALAYKIAGKNELALEKVKDAEKAGFGWRSNLDSLKKVIEIYQELRDDANLINLYSLAINMNPKNAQFWAGQAVALANLGQFKEARQSAQKAIELNPDFAKDIEEFLKSLPAQ